MTKKPVLQGGVQNYLGKQKQVTAPIKWKSSPDHPETELAYITKAEKDLLVKQDLHGSLKGGVNKGPSGIMSLNGFGSADESQNVSGAAASAAESGRNTSDTLAEGMSAQDVRDFQAAAVASGAGQRVNPGFFDSRNTVDPEVLSAARNISPAAFKATRGGGLLGLISGGGFFGNLIRNLGQRFGLGKTYDQPTYDMRRFSGLPLGGSAAFANLDIRDKFDRRGNLIIDDDDEQDILVPMAKPNIFNYNNSVGRFNTDQAINTNNIMGASQNMIDANQMADYFNNAGITATPQFDLSPYGRINDDDMVP